MSCYVVWLIFFGKQKTAYVMRISDWSSDVCSSDLPRRAGDRPGLESLARPPGCGTDAALAIAPGYRSGASRSDDGVLEMLHPHRPGTGAAGSEQDVVHADRRAFDLDREVVGAHLHE